ncbi:hypothetical protein [Marinobacter sp. F4216]|uniref:hypothetical protein n=1 Tax=Marinobacter sp. F4216 TaxID=2874281 RepID=UPI001CBFAAC0|nr:hypothetical protein [Marinobacter sp. F4216]MBZ2168095.1 hypothetical protein [Marinobacter sp. F4216]
MIKKQSVIALGAAVTLSGCAAMYPQSRDAYIDEVANYDGMFKSLALIESTSVATPFEDAVANLQSQVGSCISTDLEEVRVGAHFTAGSTTLERNNVQFNKVSDERAELTLQQFNNAYWGQPDGGVYILAANITRDDEEQTRIDVYTGTNYRPVYDAIQQWASGSKACHGIGGKD